MHDFNFRLGLPIYKEEYLHACMDAQQLLDGAPYMYKSATANSDGKTIAASVDLMPLEQSEGELKVRHCCFLFNVFFILIICFVGVKISSSYFYLIKMNSNFF